NPDIVKVSFTKSFFGSRLCKELCALARIDLPNDKDSDEELNKKNIQAIEELISQNKIILFDDFQNVIDENNAPMKDVSFLIDHCSKIDILKKCPIFIISNRKFKVNVENIDTIKSISIRGLEDKFIERMVIMELRDVSKYNKIDIELREKFIKSLCTYPLAAKFSASLIEDFSIEFVLENIQYIKKLRIDLARVLLSKIEVSNAQERILQLLGFSEDALSIDEIQEILGTSKGILLNDIEYLVQYNFVEFEKLKIGLHPILIDIFASKAITAGIIKNESEKIISAFKIIFKRTTIGELDYVHWLSKLQRMFIITGNLIEAQKIWYNCKGELKSTIMDLYSRSRNYELALEYCNKYLEDEPEDFSVKMFKIKSLIKLSKYDVALELVDELLTKQSKNPILLHQKARVYLRNRRLPDNYKKSRELLLKALSYRKDYFPVIRDLAETLLYLGELDESEKYLTNALNKAPLDQYILTLYGKVLGELGKADEAIARLKIALGNIPDAAPFFHRLGWLYQKKGDCTEAYKYYKKACDLDNHYFEARFGLIYCCIQLEGKLDEAKSHIDELEKVVSGQGKYILASMKAEYSLKEADVEGAYNIIQIVLSKNKSDVIILGSAIKITIAMSKKWFKDGLKTKAEELANQVERYIEEIETLNPLDSYIQTYKRWLNDLFDSFK
ncbi:MAG: tetratricopeptide repeat protein, partial [archaeon]